MCDFSGRLIVWLDRELPSDEAAEVERHLEACSGCRNRVDTFKRVSSKFDAYCDAAIETNVQRGAPRWVPAVFAAGAVAAIVALFLVLPRTPVEPPAFRPPQAGGAESLGVTAKLMSAPVGSVHRVHRRQAVTPVRSQNALVAPAPSQNAYSLPEERVIQIAIPADEMFPPGAVPEGIHFVADLTIAPDGSAERLRLRPRLAGFERRTTLP